MPGTSETLSNVGDKYVCEDVGGDLEIPWTAPDSVLLISTEDTIDFGGERPVGLWVHDGSGEGQSLGDDLGDKSAGGWIDKVRQVAE